MEVELDVACRVSKWLSDECLVEFIYSKVTSQAIPSKGRYRSDIDTRFNGRFTRTLTVEHLRLRSYRQVVARRAILASTDVKDAGTQENRGANR